MNQRAKLHLQYRKAAREAFQCACICAGGVVIFAIFSAACIFKGVPAGAIACAMGCVLAGFGMFVQTRDYRDNENRAWLTRPRPEEDCL